MPDARRLSQHLKKVYAPLQAQMTPLDRFKTVWRPYYAPIAATFPFIDPGTSVLEIGCGMGPVIFSIAGYHEVSDYLGIDKDPKVVSIARKANRFDRFSFQTGTLFDISPDRLQRYNTLICFDVLHHLPGDEKQAFLRYLLDAACANAVVLIKDFDARPRAGNLANTLTDWISTRSWVSYISRQELIRLLAECGFSILKVEKRNMWVWRHLFVAARKTGG